jgi:hypothetical protein
MNEPPCKPKPTASIEAEQDLEQDFMRRRAGDAKPEDLKAFLASAPDVPPEPGDEIPDHLRAKLRRTAAGA